MRSDFKKAQEQYQLISDIAKSVFNEMARSAEVIVNQVAIVASYDSDSKKATVYFPTDLSTESTKYMNLTGEDLTVGQKVYVFYKYGDIEQGWILVK